VVFRAINFFFKLAIWGEGAEVIKNNFGAKIEISRNIFVLESMGQPAHSYVGSRTRLPDSEDSRVKQLCCLFNEE